MQYHHPHLPSVRCSHLFSFKPLSLIGCLVIGVVENLFGAYVSTAFKDAFAFGIIVVVLMARPAGLFTRRVGTKV